MRPAAPSTRLALVTITDAPSVTYATVVGTGGAVVVGSVDCVIADVGAVVICDGSVVVEDDDESSSSSPPHAPSRSAAAATAPAIDSSGARRRRRDIGDEEVASGPHARVTRAKLVQADP